MSAQAQARFPDARLRILSLPRKQGDPITIRMKRADEWLPNGRSMVWFDAATGRMLDARDALELPAGANLFNQVYPLHAAKVGGLADRLVMTVTGALKPPAPRSRTPWPAHDPASALADRGKTLAPRFYRSSLRLAPQTP